MFLWPSSSILCWCLQLSTSISMLECFVLTSSWFPHSWPLYLIELTVFWSTLSYDSFSFRVWYLKRSLRHLAFMKKSFSHLLNNDNIDGGEKFLTHSSDLHRCYSIDSRQYMLQRRSLKSARDFFFYRLSNFCLFVSRFFFLCGSIPFSGYIYLLVYLISSALGQVSSWSAD